MCDVRKLLIKLIVNFTNNYKEMACNIELNKNSMIEYSGPIFNVLALTVHDPLHRPFDAVQLSCPLNRKTPPKHYVSTSMFDGRLVTVPFTAKQLTLLRHRKV